MVIQTKLQEAIRLHRQNQLELAKSICEEILTTEPNHADTLHLLGIIEYQTNNAQRALALITRAIEVNPSKVAFHFNCGKVLQETKQWEAAVASYDRVNALKPDFAESHFNRGSALQELKRFEEAVKSYDCALAIEPNMAEIYFNRGIALQELKRWKEAIENFDRAISLKPDYADAYFNRGLAFKGTDQLQAAVESYDCAIAIRPGYAESYFNRGNALQDLKRFEDAVKSYEDAIKNKSDFAEAYINHGNALQELKQAEAAVESYDRALAMAPNSAGAFNNRGNALLDCWRSEEAIESYNRAIAIDPEFVDAYINLGNCLRKSQQTEGAFANYDRAIYLKPDCAAAYANRAILLQELKQFEAAIADYGKAITLKPDFDFVLGALLHTKMKIADWSDFEKNTAELVERINHGEKVSPGFPLLSLVNNLSAQKKAAEILTDSKYPVDYTFGEISKHPRPEKIRIGYFSADFYFHPVSILLAEVFELHDRNRFEVIGFSFGDNINDAMRQRIESAFDQFIDINHLSNKEAAQLVRQMKIDIAIDLGGDTAKSRTGIFAYRAAPIQAGYIGYLGTMGADYFDYIIADSIIIPEKYQQHYTEKVAYLKSFQANDSKRVISSKQFTRKELGLPEKGFVFCSFNDNYKITPFIFDSWMRILKAVPESVLFLYAGNELVQKNLKKEASDRDVDPSRLIFGGRISPDEYLARYRSAGLFLDTFPYNAGATASDALWAGLPLVTLSGETFASRMASSLLSAIELPQLITHTQEAYETLAIELAMNPDKLRAITEKLAANRLTTLLFDTKLFTKHIESAYAQMVERYQAGAAPDHIYVE